MLVAGPITCYRNRIGPQIWVGLGWNWKRLSSACYERFMDVVGGEIGRTEPQSQDRGHCTAPAAAALRAVVRQPPRSVRPVSRLPAVSQPSRPTDPPTEGLCNFSSGPQSSSTQFCLTLPIGVGDFVLSFTPERIFMMVNDTFCAC